MTMAGARGETQQEMAKVLHLVLVENRLYPALGSLGDSLADITDFTSVPAVWGQDGFVYEAPFLNLVKNTYGAPLRTVDFGGYQVAAD